jgi:O-antigen ligase
VPVKDHITQNMEFAVCIFALAALAAQAWARRRHWWAVSMIAVALVFAANIFYVATSRTILIALPVLLVLFGCKHFRMRGLLVLLLAAAALTALAWTTSSNLRERVTRAVADVEEYQTDINTPVGLRLEFWRRSLEFVAQAPLIGHGTGAIEERLRRGGEARPAAVTSNPHNQILAVAFQLGVLGAALLIAMWVVQSQAIQTPRPARLDRPQRRGPVCRLIAVQFASVRFHARPGLRPCGWRRPAPCCCRNIRRRCRRRLIPSGRLPPRWAAGLPA